MNRSTPVYGQTLSSHDGHKDSKSCKLTGGVYHDSVQRSAGEAWVHTGECVLTAGALRGAAVFGSVKMNSRFDCALIWNANKVQKPFRAPRRFLLHYLWQRPYLITPSVTQSPSASSRFIPAAFSLSGRQATLRGRRDPEDLRDSRDYAALRSPSGVNGG